MTSPDHPRPPSPSQGQLIPPDQGPPSKPSQGQLAAPDPTSSPLPQEQLVPLDQKPPAAPSQGRLIAPVGDTDAEEDPGPATGTAAAKPTPAGSNSAPAKTPPLPESLWETDFNHAACRLELRRLGAVYREIPPVRDPGQRDCGILRPVEVTEILPGIALEGGAVMRCDTARELAHWMAEVVVPAARHLPGSPGLTGLSLGTTYQCREVVGGPTTARVSEHALGNAVDIAGFSLDDGTRLAIAPVGERGDLSVAFQNAVQGAACLFFTTVLGPGSNAAHDDHLHLDVKARNGGFRLCQ